MNRTGTQVVGASRDPRVREQALEALALVSFTAVACGSFALLVQAVLVWGR
ncbi:hypothetical protein [Nocardioides yefusunii]|uniref:Uncharacterized protein n=1 Tax=Nocardioides yefusunii TaxID=2500546 RepID=A0ABW1QUV7_9ACTN|nr:hypothetical protein [Nocardioides yefusunii]